MKIKSDASPDELTSPFYKANKEFCSVFETYIASKNGMIKGNITLGLTKYLEK